MGAEVNSLDLVTRHRGATFIGSAGQVYPSEPIALPGTVLLGRQSRPISVELGLWPHEIEELAPYFDEGPHGVGIANYKSSDYRRLADDQGYEVHIGTWEEGGSHEPGVQFIAVSDPLPLLPVLACVALGACVLMRALDSLERREFVRDCQASGGIPEVHVEGGLETELLAREGRFRLGCRAKWSFQCLRP
jgi:hypothetical protein